MASTEARSRSASSRNRLSQTELCLWRSQRLWSKAHHQVANESMQKRHKVMSLFTDLPWFTGCKLCERSLPSLRQLASIIRAPSWTVELKRAPRMRTCLSLLARLTQRPIKGHPSRTSIRLRYLSMLQQKLFRKVSQTIGLALANHLMSYRKITPTRAWQVSYAAEGASIKSMEIIDIHTDALV